jgi:alkylation response protein AidB-like acyl-CoA dehydrogenase
MLVNLVLSDEQAMFADIIDRLLADRYNFERRLKIVGSPTGRDDEIHRALAELGCFGLPIDPCLGGFGGTMIDVSLMMEALGRHLVVEPVLANAVLAGRLAARLGANDLVERMMAGNILLAFADGRKTLSVKQGRLSGQVRLVPGAAHADIMLVATTSDDGSIALFSIPAHADGLLVTRVRLLDGGRAADLRFNDVEGPLMADGCGDALQIAFNDATVAAMWEAVGSMNAAFRQTAAYMRERKQFGRPLADFQVVQHRMAEMAVACQEARASALLAALTLDRGCIGVEAARGVSGGKVKVAQAARTVGQGAVQLHGGMGVSQELPIASHFRKLLAFEASFGTTNDHVVRYADTVLPSGLHRTSAVLADVA